MGKGKKHSFDGKKYGKKKEDGSYPKTPAAAIKGKKGKKGYYVSKMRGSLFDFLGGVWGRGGKGEKSASGSPTTRTGKKKRISEKKGIINKTQNE